MRARWTLLLTTGLWAPALARAQDTDEPAPAEEEPDAPDADEDDYAEVVVTAPSEAALDPHAVETLDEAALERNAGQDLGEALSDVAGVAGARGSSDTTKPIIRGQYERRLLLLFDGVRHESQKWGLDHAPEIDPFAAGAIHVVKGAAGVRYGPDAIGGVVLVDPPPFRTEAGIGGKAQLVGVSNGMRGVAAARVDGAPEALPGFAWRLEGNLARGGALSTPDYVLGNTASQEWNGGASAGWQGERVSLEAAYRHFDFRGGVCYCVRNGTPDDFLAQLEAEEPVGAGNWEKSYRIDRPFQAVTHDLAMARAVVTRPDGAVFKATYAFQANQREEYESTRDAVTGPQYDFTLRTHSVDLFAGHGGYGVARGELQGGIGVAGTFQENVYAGLPLIPNFRAFQGGVYGYERWIRDELAFEVGARYDHLSRTAFLTRSAYDRSVGRGSLREGDCEAGDDAAKCPQAFDAASVTLGGVWHALPDRLEARLDLSSASRFPNADELYMNGTAPTFPVYALGDPGLGVETTWGASPTVGFQTGWIEAEVSTYANYIDDYVYFAPEAGPDGQPAFDVTIQGTFPRFSYRAIDAWFYGIDGGVTLLPRAPVKVVAQGSAVRAVDAATSARLVMIPSDRLQTKLVTAPKALGALQEAFAELTGLYVARQSHVDAAADFAPPPPAYFLLGAALGAELPWGERAVKLGLEGNNLLGARYRDYTSLLRYYADEPGREIRARVGFDF